MTTQAPKSGKPTKPPNHNPPTSRSSSLSTHLAMVELKQRIITSLSKLADRDTHQIAIEDLHAIIQSISPEALPMLLNSLYDSLSDSSNAKPSVKKESLHLLSLTCQSHRDLTLPHLTKIIAHIVKRLKDSDSSVKDACRDAIGVLSGLYLKGGGGAGGEGGGDSSGVGSMVGLFVRPLFEAMGEQNKGVQSGAAMCMAKMVDCAAMEANDSNVVGGDAGNVPIVTFAKLCPRICKLLNGQNLQAKAALLGVVTSLAQVGSIAPQGLEPLLQSIHECLGSTDWATRKAAAEALCAIALHSSSLITDGPANSTLAVLETCHFDKIKPVRDSMNEALQLWKKIAGKGDGIVDDQKASSDDVNQSEKPDPSDANPKPSDQKTESSARDSSRGSSPTVDSATKSKPASIPDKAVVILKKKAPALTDKVLNPEFFQKLETRGSGDLPVEVVVPRRFANSSILNNEEDTEPNDSRGRSNRTGNSQTDDLHGSLTNKYRSVERGISGKDSKPRSFDDDRHDVNRREASSNRSGFSKSDGQSEGSLINSKGNWLAIQRQLLQLERQQTHLMNMLQDFMGGSHDSMVTLENRVRGLERIVEDMAHDLSISSGRRGGNFSMGFEGPSSRSLGKYNGFSDYSSAKYNARVPFGERFAQSDATGSGMRGRGSHWRSDMSDGWDFPSYGNSRNGQVSSRRAAGGSNSLDVRSPKSESESDQVGNRRAWDKGTGPVRLGEGPSARSVWQASKDEATLEAIRVAGEDSGLSRTARVAIPEMTAEAMGDDNGVPERDPIWTSWSNAMDALKEGDLDTAYAEVGSTGDDLLLVKLMDRTGPVLDQLAIETACEVLNAIGQFLLEPNLFDICLYWIQQLVEMAMENGAEMVGIPMELKKELLLNLHEASTAMDVCEEWEGASPGQLLIQLASAWGIELQHFDK